MKYKEPPKKNQEQKITQGPRKTLTRVSIQTVYYFDNGNQPNPYRQREVSSVQ